MKKEETDEQKPSAQPLKQETHSHPAKNEQAEDKGVKPAPDHKHDDYVILESGLGVDE